MGIFTQIENVTEDILSLIPQREPLVMIDRFYGIDGAMSYSSLTVREDNICVRNGFLQDFGIIEHIAQSAAARVGYIAQQQGNKPPVGFIGSIDNFTLTLLPATGATLYTQITVEQEFENITLISAVTHTSPAMDAAAQICSCKMKIFLQQ
jgi:predicted hotdog family 3-hydroxylacyl-ACP dehydratase